MITHNMIKGFSAIIPKKIPAKNDIPIIMKIDIHFFFFIDQILFLKIQNSTRKHKAIMIKFIPVRILNIAHSILNWG